MSANIFKDSPWRWIIFSDGSSGHPLMHLGLLLLRIYAGVSIAQAGLDKLPTSNWFAADVAELGFPFPKLFAFAAVMSEFAGGWLLVVGLLTRPAGLLLSVTMGVAAFASHAEVPFFAIHESRLYFWIFVTLTLTGAGRISLDHLARNGRLPRVLVGLVPLALLSYGAYFEWFQPTAPTQQQEVDVADIQSISVAGNFNAWDLTATPMKLGEDDLWRATVEIEAAGPIEFKFAANEDWALNLGASPDAKSGFPLQDKGMVGFNSSPPNIKAYIPEAGQYEFTLNMTGFEYTLDVLDSGQEQR